MCRFVVISRSGYYGYVSQMDISTRDLPLAENIRECQQECGKTYSTYMTLKQGIYHNPKIVLRIMNKYELLSVTRRKKYRNYSNCLHCYDKLLDQSFNADRPNQK